MVKLNHMDKPRVSKLEFKEIRQVLASHDFSQQERDEFEQVFRGDLEETGEQ